MMRRRVLCLLTSVTAAVALAGCGTFNAPTAPTNATNRSSSAFGVIAIDATAASAAMNFADCLSGSTASSCFSSAGVRALGATAAAASAPGAPLNLTASSAGSAVTLTWVAPNGGDPTTAYIIEAGSAPGLANLTSFSTGNARTVFQASGVGAGTYYVRIRAANAFGTSAASNEAILVVGRSPGVAPGAPGGLTNTVNSSGTVGFAWNAASGSPTSYVIEAGSRSGLSDLANSDLGSAATAMTATGVGAGTYYVRVRAKNAFGTSAPSNEVVLIVGALGCRPNLEVSSLNFTGTWVSTVAVGPSTGLTVTFVFQRLPGSDVFFTAPYSDTSGRRGFGGGLISGSTTVHPRVELYFNPEGTSPVTDGAFFRGDLSVCSGNTVLEFAGEVHMGYLGSRPCQPGESCPGGGVHLIGPGFPMTLTRR